jgi:hypothetical protein
MGNTTNLHMDPTVSKKMVACVVRACSGFPNLIPVQSIQQFVFYRPRVDMAAILEQFFDQCG